MKEAKAKRENDYTIDDFTKALESTSKTGMQWRYKLTYNLSQLGMPKWHPHHFDECYVLHAPYEEAFYLVHEARKQLWYVSNDLYLGKGNYIRIHSPKNLLDFIPLLEERTRGNITTKDFHYKLNRLSLGERI